MRWGIAIRQTDNALVDQNDIMGPAEGSDAVAQCGVGYFQNSTNTRITNNKIHDFISNFMGSIGIKCDNDNNSTPTYIVNNSIYNIGAWGLNPGVSLTHAQGITVRQGGNIKIWNNSINLSGPYLYGGDSYAPSSACIALWNQSPVNSDTYDIRNNILKNSMTNTFPNPDPYAIGKAYGIMFTNSISDMVTENNDYFIDGYQGQIAQQYGVGGTFLINYPDLASWQAFTGTDIYSVSINPQFISNKNLLPQSVALNNLGVHIPEVVYDITGETRSNPPDMGAYEFGTPPLVHNINIPAGWSGISSYLKPSNPDMDAVLYPILNSLDMLNNFTGMYYPDGNIFTLETWNEYSGYAIKVSEPVQLAIGFSEVTNKLVNLNQGWNFIPVLSSTEKSISSLFNGVTGFSMAKDVAGGGVYWPAYSVNTIGNVQPGKAYYVKMSTSGSINYGTFGDNLSNIKTTGIESLSTPWNKVSVTPASHTVVFNTISGLFNNGDIIGGFTPEGICAGVQEITDSNAPFALSLNADDIYTLEKDGFTEGNQLNYKLYRPSTGETFDLAVTYDQSMNTGAFESNGASVVVAVKTVETGVVDPALVSLKIYPNPSKGNFTIDGISINVNIRIFNAFGEEVYHNGTVLPASIDLSAKGKGVYYAKIESASGTKIEKIVIN